MKLTMQPYKNDDDYWRIRQFLRHMMLRNGRRELSWHVGAAGSDQSLGRWFPQARFMSFFLALAGFRFYKFLSPAAVYTSRWVPHRHHKSRTER